MTNRCFEIPPSWVGRAAMLASLLSACSSDSTRVIELDESTMPAQPQGSGGTTSQTAAGGASSTTTGGSEAGAGGVALNPGGAGGTSVPPPGELWDDGISVDGTGSGAEERLLGVAIDPQDNVYAVGYRGPANGGNRSMLIVKVNADGVLDADFDGGQSGNGAVVVDLSPYTGTPDDASTADVNEADNNVEEATDVAVQSTGQIIVAGRVEDPSIAQPDATTPVDIVILRLGTDGNLDAAFGDAGITRLNPGGGANDLVYGIAVDASDRIYVFGHGTTSDPERTDQDRYAWRLNPDGSLDDTFATGGEYSFDIPQGTSTLALNDNSRRGSVVPMSLGGGVVLGGYTNVAGRNQVVLVKLDESGVPDPSFSGDGVVRLAPFPTGMAEAYGAALQSDGSVVTTGYGNVDLERTGGAELLDMVSFRVKPDGSFDSSWGTNGSAVYDPAGGEDRGRAIATLADDRVVIAGTATVTAGDKNAMLLLLDEDGAPAVDFAPGVHKAYDFGGTNEELRAVAISPNGTFIASVGFSSGRPNGAVDNAVLAIVPILPIAE